MTLISEITGFLEQVAPLSLQESYDNAGLIVGNPKTKVTGVVITLDSTEDVVDEAIKNNCNLIIAHHPIVFSGLKKITGKSYVERVIIKAIKNDIAIYAAHTNLDAVPNGVNKKIAERIELNSLEFLTNKPSDLKAGSGMIGSLDQAISFPEFLSHLKSKMDLSCIRHTDFTDQVVQKIAICGGSGSFLLQDAIAKKADVFVTADFKYHEFFDADDKIIIVDIGHYESEVFTKDLFYEFLSEKFTNIALLLSNVNTNPISYYK